MVFSDFVSINFDVVEMNYNLIFWRFFVVKIIEGIFVKILLFLNRCSSFKICSLEFYLLLGTASQPLISLVLRA